MAQIVNVFVVAAVALVQSSAAPKSSQRALVGCYSVNVGDWRPVLDSGPTPRPLIAPAHVRLTGTRGTSGWAKKHLVVVPALGATAMHDAMYWDVSPEGEIQIVFTSGSAGMRISLRADAAGLTGVARSFWAHGPFPEQTAAVTLSTVPCER